MPRKRAAAEAASPVSGLATGIGAILFSSQSSQGSVVVGSQGSILAADAMDSQDGSQQYSQPEYFSGDFCTPEDQVADLGWSQEPRGTENSEPNSAASSAGKMCPPTPDSAAKRRKTKQASANLRAPKQAFMYELDALPEDEEQDGEDGGGGGGGGGVGIVGGKGRPSAPSRKAPPAPPSKGKGSAAASKQKGGKGTGGAQDTTTSHTRDIRSWLSQDSAPAATAAEAVASPTDGGRASKDCMDSASPTGGALFADKGSREGGRRSSGGTKVGAKACRRNPFLATPLTDKEKKTPSRPLPRLGEARASRYLQDFEELAMLGHGNFGSVSLARSRIDGAKYAIKRKEGVRNDSGELTKQEEKAMREVWAMAATVHVPHVVRYHGAWCEENQLFIQMEACECHIKERYLGKNPGASVLLKMIEQIGTALAGLHEMGLGHLDVKPDNIYCAGPDFRLGDFGLACSQKMVYEGVEPEEGDGRYASPEVIRVCLSLSLFLSLSPSPSLCLSLSLSLSLAFALMAAMPRQMSSSSCPLRAYPCRRILASMHDLPEHCCFCMHTCLACVLAYMSLRRDIQRILCHVFPTPQHHNTELDRAGHDAATVFSVVLPPLV
jgi:hypothetical protein